MNILFNLAYVNAPVNSKKATASINWCFVVYLASAITQNYALNIIVQIYYHLFKMKWDKRNAFACLCPSSILSFVQPLDLKEIRDKLESCVNGAVYSEHVRMQKTRMKNRNKCMWQMYIAICDASMQCREFKSVRTFNPHSVECKPMPKNTRMTKQKLNRKIKQRKRRKPKQASTFYIREPTTAVSQLT